ncbi:HAD-IIA family hydrolase [Candidatus Magnetaquicoccus inordinatus]|uniref:HAD-IIA family hydrolase n=1 Tax=Candidatus Magnetaquicoccus inordinatus TaxID=2496818 RepID=UPI00102CD527|nr:HAD-IIA family hydrolase [Candidatus Magnetaquicoccus inordinatus]
MKPLIHDSSQLAPLYARYRARLCHNDSQLGDRLLAGKMQQLAFAELSAQFDLILLDAYGVLYRGKKVIPGAPEAVARLYQQGRAVRVLSNNASQTPEHLSKQLHDMGFCFPQKDIITSGMAIADSLAAAPWQNQPYYLIGSEESLLAYAPDQQRLCVNLRPGAGWQDARFLLMCSNRDYYGQQQQQQVESLLAQQPLPIVLANPDLVTPEESGAVSVVAGYTAATWVDRFHCPWVGLGKPFAPVYQRIHQEFPHLSPQRCLMVGDTLDTDILGGAAQGFVTCLTLSGAYAHEQNLPELCRQRAIRPDFVVTSIAA